MNDQAVASNPVRQIGSVRRPSVDATLLSHWSLLGQAGDDRSVVSSALQSSVLFQGGRPWPPVADALARTRSNCVHREVGWEATERTRQTIMTNEHDSATVAATSLLDNGEVCGARALHPPRLNTDARMGPAGVVGDSMSGKEDACECRRSAGTERPSGRPVEVRAAVVAKNRGNSWGAKSGRKANVGRP